MTVALIECREYQPAEVMRAVERCFEAVGGVGRVVAPGQRVLLKPNLLSASEPEKAIVTHPMVVEAVARMVIGAGAECTIADTPGIGTPYTERVMRRLYEKTGMVRAAEGSGAALDETGAATEASVPDGVAIRRMHIIQAALDADVIINLPKLKTHCYMTLTGALKNLFGLVPGLHKPGYHSKLASRDRFADMLLDIVGLVKPRFNILDAVVAMEGDGPGSGGTPRALGFLAASTDPVALEVAACRVIGFEPEQVPALQAARRRGWWTCEPEVVGERLARFAVRDFRPPTAGTDPAGFDDLRGLAVLMRPLLKSALTPRPLPQRGRCTACGTCVRACPQACISIEEGLAVVEDSRCIRCYCCHELCPERAIELRHSRLGRWLQRRRLLTPTR